MKTLPNDQLSSTPGPVLESNEAAEQDKDVSMLRALARSGLWGRYRSHLAFWWRNRHEITLPDLQPHESEFLPAALALQTRPASTATRFINRIIISIVVFMLLWSIFGKLDIIVNASGKIIPSDRNKSIASVETARVVAIHVKEGQSVNAGEVLIELDSRMSDHDRDKAISARDDARLQIQRARALLKSIDANKLKPLTGVDSIPVKRVQDAVHHLQSQWNEYYTKLLRIETDVTRYSKQLPLITQRAKDYQKLSSTHDVSQHSWLEMEQDKADIEGRLAEAINHRSAFIAEMRKAAQDQLNEGIKMTAALEHDIQRAIEYGDRLKLIAPVAGTIQQLTAHTLGGVVPAAQQLMIIVPEEHHIEIEAFVENKDIGFIKKGQDAEVKIETFDYTKYGTINGKVSYISRDSIDLQDPSFANPPQSNDRSQSKGSVYSVKILLNQKSINIDGLNTPLTAGMSVSVGVKLGSRRIIQYFLSPLIKHTRESLNER